MYVGGLYSSSYPYSSYSSTCLCPCSYSYSHSYRHPYSYSSSSPYPYSYSLFLLPLSRLQEIAGLEISVKHTRYIRYIRYIWYMRLQQVAGFEISVDDVEGMNVLEASEDLVHKVLQVVRRQRLGADYNLHTRYIRYTTHVTLVKYVCRWSGDRGWVLTIICILRD